ncbi:hypothetical protein GGR58DRAFT_160151 [Xylaria digitata]|nr:hypothetical protein GGR58DRAFT_160151 [Xylaria digitata]
MKFVRLHPRYLPHPIFSHRFSSSSIFVHLFITEESSPKVHHNPADAMRFPDCTQRLFSRKETHDTEGEVQSPVPYPPRWDSFLQEARKAMYDICFLRGLHKVFATGSCLSATPTCYNDIDTKNAQCQNLTHGICKPVMWILWAITGFLALMYLRRDRLPFVLVFFFGVATCGFAAAGLTDTVFGPSVQASL